MRFAHLGDCHLDGWRQPEMRELNFLSFRFAIDKCIREKVEFVLIAGDLFDSAYPSIDTLKETFNEFRRLKEENIPVFIIAGSHDFSASGKSFLDVLEKAGFCKNVVSFEEKDGKLLLHPVIFKNIAIYGYPGKKSSLEVDDIERIKLQGSPGLFTILMLHTALRDAVGTLPIKAVSNELLPKVDYLALAHLHINYAKGSAVYSGPIFPNNISELEELGKGSFYIFDNGKIKKEEIKLKEIVILNLEIKDALAATEQIISALEKEKLSGKIVILKLFGAIENGKTTDIDFQKIEDFAKKSGVYSFLKSTTKLHILDAEVKLENLDSTNLEAQIIERFEENNESKFNSIIPHLLRALHVDKLEDERQSVFEERLLSEVRRIIKI